MLFSVRIHKFSMPSTKTKGIFYCRADAEAAAEKIVKTAANSYHKLFYEIRKVAKYPRGRPAKGKARTPIGHEYLLDVEIDVDMQAVS
jgi:hypothetical protein